MTRSRLALLALVSLGSAPALALQDATRDPATPQALAEDPEEEFLELLDEYNEARTSFFQRYQAAETDEARRKLFEEEYPDAEDYAEGFLAFAAEHRQTTWAAKAFGWVVTNVGGAQRTQAIDALLADHMQDEVMASVCAALRGDTSDRIVEATRTLLEKSPHAKVRGQACFALGLQLKRKSESEGDEFELKILLGEFEELMERVTKEFAALERYEGSGEGTLGLAAEGELFAHRRLQIGMVAPDITGEDIDGTSFKLSDYRGKVVMIDFWGHW